MGKKADKPKEKPAAAPDAGEAPVKKKRSLVKLGLLALLPLVLAGGGGVGAWYYVMGGLPWAKAEAADHAEAASGHGDLSHSGGEHADDGHAGKGAHKATGEDKHGEDAEEGHLPASGAHAADDTSAEDLLDPAKPPREIKAETSFTHTKALGSLMADRCGRIDAPALMVASAEEAKADGRLVDLSWEAALRRARALTARSCGHVINEVVDADARAASGDKAEPAAKTGH